jgi:hypothetical protein
MNVSHGVNKKLGKGCGSWSRSVERTCPASCPFLPSNQDSDIPKKHRCYAERIPRRWPNVAKSWEQNVDVTREEVVQAFVKAPKKTKAIRIHTGGDFGRDGYADVAYIHAVIVGVAEARALGYKQPAWFYTHMWRELAEIVTTHEWREFGIQPFASVHTHNEAWDAWGLGYRLAFDAGEKARSKLPATTEQYGHKALTCPEQRKGVTCDACGYCFRALPNRHVAFWRH